MAYQHLHAFLVNLSNHASMRATMKRGGAPAEQLMTEAALSAAEKKLVRGRDQQAIKKYLGDKYAAAAKVNIVD